MYRETVRFNETTVRLVNASESFGDFSKTDSTIRSM